MRKLLILILVLGIASAANAALSIVGPTEINKDDTVTIDIISDSAAGQVAYLSFKYVSEGGFDLSNPRSPFLPPTIPPIPTPDDSIEFELVFASPDLMPGIWFEVDLTCLKAGVDVLVELYDSALPRSLLDSLTIHQVSGPYASNPNPADGAVITGDVVEYLGEDYICTPLDFTPGATSVKHTVYFSDNYDDVANRIEDANLVPPPIGPFAVIYPDRYFVGYPESLIRGQVYYWCVDETDAQGNVFPGDVWEFTILGFCAYAPSPPNEAALVSTDVLLSWKPGYDGSSGEEGSFVHDVYLGTSWEDVNNARYDHMNPPPEYVDSPIEPNCLISGLEYNTTYYWRVDEVWNRIIPFSPGNIHKGLVWCFTTVIPVGETYHVDGATGDNTNDGLTRETAFKTIQWGINAAGDYDTVLVWPGVYNEEIGFWGDAITVKSAADAAIVETNYGYAFSFSSAEGPDTVLSNFIIRDSQYGIYLINGASPSLSNLTIVNNDFGISAFNGADPDISNCILWSNNYGDLFRDPVPLQARYSCIEEGGEGEGNISIEPGFVDANNGDYHLLSERGRYWPAHDVWVLDEVTSPCVDSGDPAVDPGDELMPNGGRINMGAYGNTAYASMSEWPIKGDVDRNGRFNFMDVAILLDEWLAELPWVE